MLTGTSSLGVVDAEEACLLGEARRPFIAYRVASNAFPLRALRPQREWMDATTQRFAYHCLPLVMANQFGWELLNPSGFSVTWDGEDSPGSLHIEWDDQPDSRICSHFGHGLLTFSIEYIFRTPSDFALLVTGPPNRPKNGIYPLEGLIETGWAPYTFTHSWSVTQAGSPIRFEKDEPIARVLPVPHDYLGTFAPVIKPLCADLDLFSQFSAWCRRRKEFTKSVSGLSRNDALRKWTGDYFSGSDQRGNIHESHRTKIGHAEFSTEERDTMDAGEFRAIWACIVRRTWKDSVFKAKVLSDPVAVLSDYGVPNPSRIQVRVFEEMTDGHLNLTIPAAPAKAELLEAYLWSGATLQEIDDAVIENVVNP